MPWAHTGPLPPETHINIQPTRTEKGLTTQQNVQYHVQYLFRFNDFKQRSSSVLKESKHYKDVHNGVFCTCLIPLQQFMTTDEMSSFNKDNRSQPVIKTMHKVQHPTCVYIHQRATVARLSNELNVAVNWCQDEACEVSCCRQECKLPH